MENLLIDLDGVIYTNHDDFLDRMAKTAFTILEREGRDKEELDLLAKKAIENGERGTFNCFLNLVGHNYDEYKVLCNKVFEELDYSSVAKNYRMFELLMEATEKYNVYVTTSNNHMHVERIFKASFDVDIKKLPIKVIDIEATYRNGRFYLKRDPEGLKIIVENNNFDPTKCTLIDDLESNLTFAKEIGMKTYHITEEHNLVKFLDDLLHKAK